MRICRFRPPVNHAQRALRLFTLALRAASSLPPSPIATALVAVALGELLGTSADMCRILSGGA
eukprot:6210884-Pleurochrysis_carterae.AAC.1